MRRGGNKEKEQQQQQQLRTKTTTTTTSKWRISDLKKKCWISLSIAMPGSHDDDHDNPKKIIFIFFWWIYFYYPLLRSARMGGKLRMVSGNQGLILGLGCSLTFLLILLTTDSVLADGKSKHFCFIMTSHNYVTSIWW